VERELARVRKEIERMEGRLRYLKAGAQLSTLSVNLHEPVPIVGVLAGAIASLGFVGPVLGLGWAVVGIGLKWRRAARTA
jgi:hypothetical protein